MPERCTLIAAPEDIGRRLDRVIAERVPTVSRSRLQQAIRDGGVRLNGEIARPSQRICRHDRIDVELPAAPAEARPESAAHLALTLLYLDEALAVVDKPAGQVVHPAAGHVGDTLVNALLARLPDLAEVFDGSRPGVVHRLDRDTSGVLVVARSASAAEALKAQFQARSVDKTYLALARGTVAPPEGVIDAPVGRDPRRRQRMAAQADGRPARTAFRVLAVRDDYSWLELSPHTGRTHQIRVHLAAIGHPVAGDTVYGRRDRIIARMALHAWRLAIDHPDDGRRMSFTAPLPADLCAALATLGIEWRESA